MPRRNIISPRPNSAKWVKNDHRDNDQNYSRMHRNKESTLRSDNFKHSRVNKMKRNINAQLLLDSDDVDMGGMSGGNIRMHKGGRRGGSSAHMVRAHMVRRPQKSFIIGALPWYQVVIPYGGKHEKDLILKALLSYLSPDIFIPHYYKVNGNAAIFYVDDVNMAEKLFYADRKITLPDGFKMVVIVRNSVPNVNVDSNLKEKMKMAMVKRYNPATKAMDLTKFHADPDLSEVFCGLFRPPIMLAALDIISENIPDLEALNLNDNKLHSTDHLKVLPTKLSNLKVLYLGDNKIPHLRFLDPLKGLKLVELNLKGNPLATRYNDEELYVSDIRKKFPKLLKLDGTELPPAIEFDVGQELELPAPQQSFLVDPNGQEFLRTFLTQFYSIYDSESRQPLLEAYHENAAMSISANYSTMDNRNSQSGRLNAYITSSRNLLRVTEREGRRRHLRNGRLQIVSFLSDLPRTNHDLMGFKVDLSTFMPEMIVVTINGVFRETSTPGNPLRSFHRTLVIVPNGGGGFCISNDILFVTNAAPEQIESAFTDAIPAVAAPAPAMPTAPAAIPAAAPTEDAMKMQMVMMISQQTGMNEFWSTNCLQEMNWDLNRAAQIFTQLHAEGKIPPEAFIK